MTVSSEELRIAMRAWATGVTIVGVQHEGVMHGMTVSSYTSVSLDPPLVLVSLEMGTRTYSLLEKSGVFGVTILEEKQQEVSNCFANPSTELGDRFAGREVFQLETGAPFVAGGIAFFDCRVTKLVPAGNHILVIAEVVAAKSNGPGGLEGTPLIYFNRRYHSLNNA
ncbi:MAG TPA: flavin reductase family protein [Anaerolineales bacterium]|nr:flavin reductase family protein [Anaerolineales bacterium]